VLDLSAARKKAKAILGAPSPIAISLVAGTLNSAAAFSIATDLPARGLAKGHRPRQAALPKGRAYVICTFPTFEKFAARSDWLTCQDRELG